MYIFLQKKPGRLEVHEEGKTGIFSDTFQNTGRIFTFIHEVTFILIKIRDFEWCQLILSSCACWES